MCALGRGGWRGGEKGRRGCERCGSQPREGGGWGASMVGARAVGGVRSGCCTFDPSIYVGVRLVAVAAGRDGGQIGREARRRLPVDLVGRLHRRPTVWAGGGRWLQEQFFPGRRLGQSCLSMRNIGRGDRLRSGFLRFRSSRGVLTCA